MGSNVTVEKPMAPQPSSPGRKPSFRRAFLPLWVALVFGILIMARDYHLRHSILTRLAVKVTVDGKEPEQGFSVTVNGASQSLYAPLPMGSVEIGIHAPESEPKSYSRFVWYGVTDLGSVNLSGSRGSLEARVLPTPDIYELAGKRGNWTNTTGSFLDLPVGRYELVSRFGSLIERTRVQVDRNRTSRIDVAAKIGSLELSSDPPEGAFELLSPATESLVGTFPATYARLPEGEYRLVAKRTGYERKLELRVRRNETNRVVVKFVYGAAQIISTPAGATVSWAGTEKGKTPLSWTNLVPGTYQIGIELEGYDSRFVEMKVDDEAPSKVGVTLVNTRYREAMEGARLNLENNRFERAAQFLDAALLAQPGDAAAAKLLPIARAGGLRSRAEELADRGEFEAALSALDSALTNVPDDPATRALQGKIKLKALSAKNEIAQQQIETRFQKLMTQAKSAVTRQEFDIALALLSSAKKDFPDRSEIVELEAAARRGLAKRIEESPEKKRQNAIEALERQIKDAWQRSLSGEKDAKLYPVQRWKTSKSGEEVLAVVQKLGRIDETCKVSELTTGSTEVFTAKMGDVNPSTREGNYVRIGVVDYGGGNTEIEVMVIGYWLTGNGVRPEPPGEHLQRRAERMRSDLAKFLRAEVK